MPEPDHPEGDGVWTLLRNDGEHVMWQQDETGDDSVGISRFWIVNPPETLMYDTFDEAEAMFEALAED